ncbi:MAG: hypothetical protein ACRDN9_07555 [Streptosporangiaceae bacterium]
MALRFLGINPNTPDDGSPTLWLDEDTGDYVIQSYRADEMTLAECRKTGGIPDHETVIRWPAVMMQFFPEANAKAAEADDGNGDT